MSATTPIRHLDLAPAESSVLTASRRADVRPIAVTVTEWEPRRTDDVIERRLASRATYFRHSAVERGSRIRRKYPSLRNAPLT